MEHRHEFACYALVARCRARLCVAAMPLFLYAAVMQSMLERIVFIFIYIDREADTSVWCARSKASRHAMKDMAAALCAYEEREEEVGSAWCARQAWQRRMRSQRAQACRFAVSPLLLSPLSSFMPCHYSFSYRRDDAHCMRARARGMPHAHACHASAARMQMFLFPSFFLFFSIEVFAWMLLDFSRRRRPRFSSILLLFPSLFFITYQDI